MPLYQYWCEPCEHFTDRIFKYDEKPAVVPCEQCEALAEYQVGNPAQLRIKYDQNGRVGYRMSLGDGRQIHRSATREKYEHTLGNKSAKDVHAMGVNKNKSVYTKEYGRHKERVEKTKFENFKKALTK
jgi:hypothetical protein